MTPLLKNGSKYLRENYCPIFLPLKGNFRDKQEAVELNLAKQNPRYSTRLHPWTTNVLGFFGALPCAVEKSIVLLSFLAYSQKALCRHRRKNDGKVISIVLVRAVIGTTLLIKSKFNRNPFPSRYNFRETISDELSVS